MKLANAKILQPQNNKNTVSFPFKYIELQDEYVIVPENLQDESERMFPGKKILSGEIQIKVPKWTDIYEIERRGKGYSRKVTKDNPFGKKRLIFIPEKLKFWKIKTLCKCIIEHDGSVNYLTEDIINNLDISFSQLILSKIDLVISQAGIEGLQKEDGDILSKECYNYYSKIKKAKRDPYIDIPEPPSVIILMRLSKMLGLTFDQVRSMDKKDIDEIFIAKNQENICENPAALGMGKKIPVDQNFLKKNTEAAYIKQQKNKDNEPILTLEQARQQKKKMPPLYGEKKG